ncbi:MAG: hypothetical protein KDK30_11350 [Leptospiraceae bacterium]|nr:hypothetical protein [Leptospiraceae bacterium]
MSGLSAAILVASCSGRAPRGLPNSDPGFQIHQGSMSYEGRPFTGIMRTEFPAGWRETPYVQGEIHGVEKEFYADGRLAQERPYEHNRKEGVHRGWYPSGKMRFYYEFENGQHHGEAYSWHENGHLYEYARYEHGYQVGQKTWRSDGKIFANYVQIDGRKLMGLIGSKLCVGVEADDDGRTIRY